MRLFGRRLRCRAVSRDRPLRFGAVHPERRPFGTRAE